jgi:hypothetical protein
MAGTVPIYLSANVTNPLERKKSCVTRAGALHQVLSEYMREVTFARTAKRNKITVPLDRPNCFMRSSSLCSRAVSSCLVLGARDQRFCWFCSDGSVLFLGIIFNMTVHFMKLQ